MSSGPRLFPLLNEKGLIKTALAKELGIFLRTVAKIGRGEKIAVFLVALQMNYARPFRITVFFKHLEMKKASVCPEVCTMNFKYG